MTTKDALIMALRARKKTQSECAELMGWTVSKMNRKLNSETFRISEFLLLLDKLELDLQLIDRSTGEPVKVLHRGYGPRVRQMVNGVIYDTAQADALSNSFYADGIHEFTDDQARELYMDHDGRYFFAEYATYQKKGRITPVDPETASRFITKYGTTIFKAPAPAEDSPAEPEEAEELEEPVETIDGEEEEAAEA